MSLAQDEIQFWQAYNRCKAKDYAGGDLRSNSISNAIALPAPKDMGDAAIRKDAVRVHNPLVTCPAKRFIAKDYDEVLPEKVIARYGSPSLVTRPFVAGCPYSEVKRKDIRIMELA